MEINLIKQFINYIESEEVDNIYTLTLDDDNNEIILNQDKYIILSFEDAKRILKSKLQLDIKNQDYNLLSEVIDLPKYIDENKLFDFILNNYNYLEDLNLEDEIKKGYSLASAIHTFINDNSPENIVFSYLYGTSVYNECLVINDDDIDDIIESYLDVLMYNYKYNYDKDSNYYYYCKLQSCFVLIKIEC